MSATRSTLRRHGALVTVKEPCSTYGIVGELWCGIDEHGRDWVRADAGQDCCGRGEVAVMPSPVCTPVSVPGERGSSAPYRRLELFAVTVRGMGLMVSFLDVSVLPEKFVVGLYVAEIVYIPCGSGRNNIGAAVTSGH